MVALRSIHRALAGVAFLAAGGGVAACGGGESGEGPGAAVVDTVHVIAMDVPATVDAVGTIEADHQTAVAAEVRGQVSRILRDEGSVVAAGTPVIQLDAGPYVFATQSAAADLSRAQATLSADEKLLARYEALLAAGAIDPATYENLEARVESGRAAVAQARAALATARWDLGKATIRAPFAGTVGRRHVQLGEYVDAQQEAFDLVDAQPVEIRFAVPELYAGRVQAGAGVRFRVRSDTVSARIAQVNYVSPQIDAGTRTFEATATYSNPDLAVRPGAYAEVQLTTEVHADAPVVPEPALVTEGADNWVYVVVDGKAERRRVTVGSRVDGRVEIADGVRPGEVVIVAGQHGLPDGAPVAPRGRAELEIEREG
ncbi:MAG TPA: efflux RND transporter periplasmic adaptor subunit [Gemmatimonadota bacterium]|nr:efflux RND transporter periplasmic adaptor subunit [Gemmatimonadota bacterium]